ncbi:MAG: PqqD family protein [Armatimonadota bacterium]
MSYQARTDRLISATLGDEVLFYDLRRHRAHRLNRTAALVWKLCDGNTSVEEIAAGLERELGTAVPGGVVQDALAELREAELLDDSGFPDDASASASRRELSRRAHLTGALAVLVPSVISITAPTAAQAASGGPKKPGKKGKHKPRNRGDEGNDGLDGGDIAAAGVPLAAGAYGYSRRRRRPGERLPRCYAPSYLGAEPTCQRGPGCRTCRDYQVARRR